MMWPRLANLSVSEESKQPTRNGSEDLKIISSENEFNGAVEWNQLTLTQEQQMIDFRNIDFKNKSIDDKKLSPKIFNSQCSFNNEIKNNKKRSSTIVPNDEVQHPSKQALLYDFRCEKELNEQITIVMKLLSYFQSQSECTPRIHFILKMIVTSRDPNIINLRHPTSMECLLHALCFHGHLGVVQLMITNPCVNVNIKDGQLNSPLNIVAMTHQNPELVKLLLDNGADVLQRNEHNLCSLHYAARSANKELLTMLLERIPPTGKPPNVLVSLWDPFEIQNADDDSQSKRIELTVYLLSQERYSIDDVVNDNGDTIQIHACRHRMMRLVELTIEYGAHAEIQNLNGETALSLSYNQPWYYVISKPAYDLLWNALTINEINEIKRLIKVGVKLNEVNCEGQYALIHAVMVSSDEVVSLLISLGADVNVCSAGMTPLLVAALKGFTSKLAMLIDCKADPSVSDCAGNNMLHLMAQGSYIEALKVGVYKTMKLNPQLLKRLVNACNNTGWTAVMEAAKSVSKECVDFLSAAGSRSVISDFLKHEAEYAQSQASTVVTVESTSTAQPATGQSMAMEVVASTASAPSDEVVSLPSNTSVSVSDEVVSPPNKVLIQQMLQRPFKDQLYHACKFGLTPVVMDLMNNNHDIRNVVDCKVEQNNYVIVKDKLTEVITCETCLYVSCYYGHTEIVRELLLCGADSNATARNGWSCLFVSAKKSYTAIVTMLIEYGADVQVKNRNDMTALNIASYNGCIDIVRLLINCKADVNQGDKLRARPLHAAVQSGNVEVVDYLLDHGADINGTTDSGISPLYVASYSGQLDIVKRFLSYVPPEGFPQLRKVDVNAMNLEGLTAITVAAFNGHLLVVQALLDAGADLYKAGKKMVTGLYAACQNAHKDVVNLLISHGADPNTPIGNRNTPVHATAIENSCEVLNVLIENQALIDTTNIDGVTPLYMACEKGHLEALNILIELGANVDTTNKNTVSPLNISAQNGHIKIVEKLIACKANINSQTIDGPSPLFIAAQNGHLEICRMLVEAGADPNLRTKEKETAIFVAGYFGFLDIVKLLIRYGALINIVDRDTRTPLWWACKAGQESVVKVLMDAGADVNISDREHVTPAMIAAQQRKAGVCELLNGAKAQATLCAVCLTNQRCCLFMPCKHLATCADCSLKLERSQAKVCPICRRSVDEVITVFA